MNQAKSKIVDVAPAAPWARRLVGPRKQAITPLVGLTIEQAALMQERLFPLAGLEDLMDCWTGEPYRRPIPFVSTDEKPKRVAEVFARYLPIILQLLLPTLKFPYQPINKISKLGWPVCRNPGAISIDKSSGGISDEDDEEQRLDRRRQPHPGYEKIDYLNYFINQFNHNDFSSMSPEHAFVMLSGRLQYESPNKKREQQFINDEGQVYNHTIQREDREIEVPKIGRRVGSRYRVVFNFPVINLWMQCFDTALHSAILEWPLCRSNMYTKQTWSAEHQYRSFDCKQFERVLGMAVSIYAQNVGGIYGQHLQWMSDLPFIIPSDTRKTTWWLQHRYGKGIYKQFGSGMCCVADLGKLISISVHTHFFVEVLGVSPREAVIAALSGTSHGFTRYNYGDDNLMTGNPEKVDAFIKFVSNYFEIEEDEHPTYLGFKWFPDQSRFMLSRDKYVAKMILRERAWDWSDYPFLAWFDRRQIFKQFGEPYIAEKIYPAEDAVLDDCKFPFSEIALRAAKEKRESEQHGIALNAKDITEKDYLMTPEEKIASGRYWGYSPTQTREMMKIMLPSVIFNQIR